MFIVTYHLLNVTILGQKRGCQLCADSILWQKDSPVPPLKRTWPPVAMFQACLCFRSCFVPLCFTRQLKNQLQFSCFFFKEKSELLFGGKCKCWRLLTPTQRLCNQIGMSTPVSMPPSSNEWQIAPNTLMTSPAEKMDVAYCRPPPWSQCFFWGGGGVQHTDTLSTCVTEKKLLICKTTGPFAACKLLILLCLHAALGEMTCMFHAQTNYCTFVTVIGH